MCSYRQDIHPETPRLLNDEEALKFLGPNSSVSHSGMVWDRYTDFDSLEDLNWDSPYNFYSEQFSDQVVPWFHWKWSWTGDGVKLSTIRVGIKATELLWPVPDFEYRAVVFHKLAQAATNPDDQTTIDLVGLICSIQMYPVYSPKMVWWICPTLFIIAPFSII